MFKWLDSLSFLVLIIVTVFLGLAPLGEQPHVLEKIIMLGTGQLVKSLDIFDLLMHSTPIILLLIKTVRWLKALKMT